MRSPHGTGTFCLVLHSHLPWLAGHGCWPVGEEWLYQAWAHAYLPVMDMLERFASEGYRDVLTLGMTPVLAAQLDTPQSLRSFHYWLGNWCTRAHDAAARWRGLTAKSGLAADEHRQASRMLARFESGWRHGVSPILRRLIDSGTVELLGGPATHSFQPLLEPPLREFALRAGLDDALLRFGHRPRGIWAPECAYRPGMQDEYQACGVTHFLTHGSALPDVSTACEVRGSEVVCFGRDERISAKVWSGSGYPGHRHYRDFHTFDHAVGIKPSRVTGRGVPPEDKRPYRPGLAARAVDQHVADFVTAVVERLRQNRDRTGNSGVVVAAFDTELFGHWWFEGPWWLEKVLRALPRAGVRVTTLRAAAESGHVHGSVKLPATSWGLGEDWQVWSGTPVADVVESNRELQERVLRHLRQRRCNIGRDHTTDHVLRETLLALSSDWAFMITYATSAGYARERADRHTARAHRLLDLLDAQRTTEAAALAREFRRQDGPFGHLDARTCRATSTVKREAR